MLRVDPSLFSNVITAIQRTGSLPGGGVRGLPNGVVIEGLNGIHSFGSDVAEAQREFQLGRVRTALERVRQIETHFNGIAGRWNSTVGSVISSAKQGHQKLSLQKLNEVKSAQTKMQQLTGPAGKALRDLVSALEHAVSMEGRPSEESADRATESEPTEDVVSAEPNRGPAVATESETPDVKLLGRFAEKFRFGPKLQLAIDANRKNRIVPRLEKDKFYFFAGFDPPGPVRIREIRRQAILVVDTRDSHELLISAVKLKALIRRGIWILVPTID